MITKRKNNNGIAFQRLDIFMVLPEQGDLRSYLKRINEYERIENIFQFTFCYYLNIRLGASVTTESMKNELNLTGRILSKSTTFSTERPLEMPNWNLLYFRENGLFVYIFSVSKKITQHLCQEV